MSVHSICKIRHKRQLMLPCESFQIIWYKPSALLYSRLDATAA